MKNLPKEKRDHLILIVLGTVACVVGIWYTLLAAQRKGMNKLAQQITEQRTKVDHAEQMVKSTIDLQQKQEVLQAKVSTIEKGMASGDMYSWIIQTINKFSAGRKVEIPQFSREVTADVGILPRFPYKSAVFTVRGTAFFHDFGKFIADFENTFPFVRVQNIEIEQNSGASSSGAASLGTSSAGAQEHPEKLTFKMEIVTLINPNSNY
ncbi:MAG TPA: type 4a pilus biogenesis protein PilO [Verrucomicrobiae bacterium]|jgi:Tfp pilus assembly protein PilO